MIGVCIVTYNQSNYIEKCINSALTQKCNEQIIVYVADDCSTDSTYDKCLSYGDKIRYVRREKNVGLVRNTMLLLLEMKNDGCEYIAMLDGDDYWCDEYKCQKEVEYFKNHNKTGLVHTCIYRLYPYGLKMDRRKTERSGYVYDIVESVPIGNCSVMFKSELLEHISFEEFMNQKFWSCDYVMYCIFSKYTEFGFIPEHTAVWRRGHDSVSHANDLEKQLLYVENGVEMWKYLNRLFPDRWSYSERGANNFRNIYSFNVAFSNCSYFFVEKYRKKILHSGYVLSYKMKLKLIVSHSYFIMKVWQLLKQFRNRVSLYY